MDATYRLPVCITVSRKTGKVTGIEYGDVTARAVFDTLRAMDRALKRGTRGDPRDCEVNDEKLVFEDHGYSQAE